MSARRPVVFGEVLFDRFPDGSEVLGGAPFNVAWHLQAFGARPLLVTRVGADPLGERALAAMRDWGLDLAGVQTGSTRPTGTVEVALEADGPRFDIVGDTAYDDLRADALPDPTDAALLYHGSLALRAAPSAEAFEALAERSALPRFLDVNLRPPWWRADELRARLRAAEWVKLNEQELAELADDGAAADGAPDPAAFRAAHDLALLILTRGERGGELLGPDGVLRAPRPPAGEAVDSVGCGDAFAAVVVLGLLERWPLDAVLERAHAFAAQVLGTRGALIRDRAVYERLRASWR